MSNFLEAISSLSHSPVFLWFFALFKSLLSIHWKGQIDSRVRPGTRGTRRPMDGGSQHCTGGGDQKHPQEKELQTGKVVVWRGLTNRWEEKRNIQQTQKDTATAILPPPPPRLGVTVCCSECQEEGTTQPLLRESHRAGVSPWGCDCINHALTFNHLLTPCIREDTRGGPRKTMDPATWPRLCNHPHSVDGQTDDQPRRTGLRIASARPSS